MARPHFVKAARKDYPDHGIAKGESYWWWKFKVGGRGGAKRFSKTKPSRSQLTQSEFLSALYAIEDDLGAAKADADLEPIVEDVVSRLGELADEQDDKHGNLPDSLQNGPTGELLEARAEACRSAASDLENVDFGDVPGEDAPEAAHTEFWQEKLEEVQAISIDAE